MAALPRNPLSWAEYEGRSVSIGSIESNAVEDDALLEDEGDNETHPLLGQERRRSSVTNRLTAMADIGGVNSLRSFARSWQRAASFAEVIPRRPSLYIAVDAESSVEPSDCIQYSRDRVTGTPRRFAGLLSEHLQSSESLDTTPDSPSRRGSSALECARAMVIADSEHSKSKALDTEQASGTLPAISSSTRSSIFPVPHHLSTSDIIGSYGSHHESTRLERHRSRSSVSQGSGLGSGREHVDAIGADETTEEERRVSVKEVRQGDHVVLTVEGQSTLPQSVFNSINALIGVGLLSLPLAFKLSGWIAGLAMLSLNAAVTAHTGKLLGKCMQYDPSIITYSDLAYVAYGSRARVIVSALFTLELVAACVALMILFSDSLNSLLPTFASPDIWKCVCGVLVLVLNMLPLRWLSYTSILGIFSTFCIVCIVILNGLIKDHAPGSLWQPAQTYLLPSNWLSLPLAYGLMASPWGAHSVFPSIFRDMRHPHKWGQAVNVTFSFSYVLDTCLAVFGILMFGDGIKEAITSNIIKTSGYPESLIILMCSFVTVIPLTKIPLNARPLITTADVICGVSRGHEYHASGSAAARSPALTRIVRALARIFVVLVLLGISILFPAFDSVCAFLGAALCSLISVILPICFYLKLYHSDITKSERITSWVILVAFCILGLVGTVWTFLPRHLVGAESTLRA